MTNKEKAVEAVKWAQKELKKAQEYLAESEETYSVGDRFMIGSNTYILACHDAGRVQLVNLKGGSRWDSSVEVNDRTNITETEMKRVVNSYSEIWARTFDYRKDS